MAFLPFTDQARLTKFLYGRFTTNNPVTLSDFVVDIVHWSISKLGVIVRNQSLAKP